MLPDVLRDPGSRSVLGGAQVLDADPNALPIGSWRALAPALLGR